MDRIELKRDAKQTLSGSWQWAVILTLLTGIISGGIGGVTWGSGYFIAGMIWIGYDYAVLDFTKGTQ